MKNFIAHIEYFKSLLVEWKILHIHRENNEVVDSLVKDAVYSRNDPIMHYN